MKNNSYYGEYSLRHWVSLVLDRKIKLPEYQRYFVWEKSDLEMLIATLKDGRFVPPITIGAYRDDKGLHNIIIDGQQRLTSLMLAFIERFPDKSWSEGVSQLSPSDDSDASDDLADDTSDIDDSIPKEWTMNKLLEDSGNTKESLQAKCEHGKYTVLSLSLGNDFWDNNFIGFCYLVPGNPSEEQQQSFFCNTFRDLNIGGKRLNEQDSRRSLYYMKKEYEKLFEPEFVGSITLRSNSKKNAPSHIDFVRYLALLADYMRHENVSEVARGRKKDMEKYFEEYVFSVVSHNTDSECFCPFTNIFTGTDYLVRMQRLSEIIVTLRLTTEFVSIVDMDVWMFGLVYWVFYKNRFLQDDVNGLGDAITKKISKYKEDQSHRRSPALFKFLRMRMQDSISIYKDFLANGTAL